LTTFPGAPRLTKGAIVGLDLINPLASVILFQYNPKTMSRALEAQGASEGGARGEAQRLSGPPRERITISELHLDAADQLEKGQASLGIYPQLSALEMLLYPKSVVTIANTILMAAGTIEIVQPDAPFTLFIWGAKRVLPVRLSSFTINEEEYDPDLNPIRASLSLTLTVLNTADFSITHPGYYLFLTHQVVKETLAVVGSVGDLGAVAGGEISI
jgi:hypothetical protein